MCTRGAVGAPAGAQLDLAQLEVLLESVPFLLGGLPIFRGGAVTATGVQERSVCLDQPFLEDREVAVGRVQAVMPEGLRGDVDRQAAGDGAGGGHPAEAGGRVVPGLAGPVGEPGRIKGVVQEPADAPGG